MLNKDEREVIDCYLRGMYPKALMKRYKCTRESIDRIIDKARTYYSCKTKSELTKALKQK